MFPSKKISILFIGVLFCVLFTNNSKVSCTNNQNSQLPWHHEQIDVSKAWEITKGNENITIAILDGGVDFTHPELNESSWINEEEIANN